MMLVRSTVKDYNIYPFSGGVVLSYLLKNNSGFISITINFDKNEYCTVQHKNNAVTGKAHICDMAYARSDSMSFIKIYCSSNEGQENKSYGKLLEISDKEVAEDPNSFQAYFVRTRINKEPSKTVSASLIEANKDVFPWFHVNRRMAIQATKEIIAKRSGQ